MPQPAARWHDEEDAPVTYVADSPDAAWAEFLRHDEITDPADLAGVARRMWAAEVPDEAIDNAVRAALRVEILTGGPESYPSCRDHAAGLRQDGATALLALSGALLPGRGGGQSVDGGLVEAGPRDGQVLCGGPWPDTRGWAVVDVGAPPSASSTSSVTSEPPTEPTGESHLRDAAHWRCGRAWRDGRTRSRR